ncbi:MAG: flagellar basal body L-ring protein FlgH [Armatimonadetes bacterium]|nr:flagellar basal body L-ring protein FlgH [Armatimonadota bacterium]
MRKTYILFTTVGLALLMAGSACAESLYPVDATPTYAKKRAAKVGDILTILIVESASSSASASTDAKKTSSSSVGPGIGPIISSIPVLSYGGNDSLKGSGSTKRDMSFTTTMTVKVTKVDEAGNLEIEGTRTVQTNKEKEEVKLTGLVRPQDVTAENTIMSSSIANAQITHTGKGPVGDTQKKGLIATILGWLF